MQWTCHLWPVRLYYVFFPRYLKKARFSKKVMEYEMCFKQIQNVKYHFL
jgi:hypothetical protein